MKQVSFVGRKRVIIDVIFVFMLFGAFMISSLFVIVFGANVYSEITEKREENFRSRTAYYYVTEKIRSHDKADTIQVKNTANTKSVALIFYENIEEKEYRTYIYYYDNYLWECTLANDEEFDYNKGTKLLMLRDFRSELVSGNLLHLYLKDSEGYISDFYVSTKVSVKDVTDEVVVGSDGPEKQDIDKKK